MENIRNVLDYIRNFFATPLNDRPRKRRCPDFDNFIVSPKFRKSSIVSQRIPAVEREIPIIRENFPSDRYKYLLAKTEFSFKKSPLTRPLATASRKTYPVVDTIVLNEDDDDDVIPGKTTSGSNKLNLSSRPRIQKFTSTPEARTTYINGNGVDSSSSEDEVKFVKEYKSPLGCSINKKKENNCNNFKYTKTGDKLFNIGTCTPNNSDLLHNGTKPKSKVFRSLTKLLTPDSKNKSTYFDATANNNRTGTSLDYSIRIDDKVNYRKLLDAQLNNSVNSSLFYTPVGKLFNYDSANNQAAKSPTAGIPKEKTKDMIIKVLDSYSSKETSVKDSDSDDVIFVSPPSPKPDIKVDPVNSFKKIVDISKASKRDWLDEIVERHKKNVDQRQQEIDEIRQCAEKQGEINKDIKVELLRRDVDRCLQLKDVILPVIEVEEEVPLPELTPDQINMVKRAWRGDPNEVLARKFNLNITRRDLMTLAGLNWLNDEVINFYMNLIIERGTSPNMPNVHCFNTFFYVKLLKDGAASLRRWTRKIEIFAMDLVCVPIHLGMHWCMAIIDFRDKSIRYYDSMGSPNNRCLEALRDYLEAEHEDKKKTSLDTSEWVLENREDIPQQMNGSDCGMFSCTFAEFVSRNAKITFKQEDMPYLRKKMVVEIMSGTLLIK